MVNVTPGEHGEVFPNSIGKHVILERGEGGGVVIGGGGALPLIGMVGAITNRVINVKREEETDANSPIEMIGPAWDGMLLE